MSEEDLRRLIEDIAEHLGVDAAQITEETSFIKDLRADSLDLVELGMMLEQRLNITIPQADYGKFVTFGDVLVFIREHSQVAETA
jgi:acyl carrier protein